MTPQEQYPNYAIFQNKDLWEKYDQGNFISGKIKYLQQVIPKDVDSILDVGCGNGLITNHLAKKYDLTGADLSREALHHVDGNKIQASADYLGFKNLSADLVFSSELLEHLPEIVLKKTINEFRRIARKYILITVPNNEFLASSFVRCPDCLHLFHIYGHLNSFSASGISDLVGDHFQTIHVDYTGPKIRPYNKFLLKVKRASGKNWFPADKFTICPKCGNKEFGREQANLTSKICNGLNLIFSKNKFYWLIIVLKRIK